MGIDASHRGDSSQHTAPLPAPAVLPSDTPIAPTPEQVNKPGPESRVPDHPRTSEDGRGGGGEGGVACQTAAEPPVSPHSSPTGVCFLFGR